MNEHRPLIEIYFVISFSYLEQNESNENVFFWRNVGNLELNEIAAVAVLYRRISGFLFPAS